MTLFDLARQHAQHCAAHELCTSPTLATAALNCTPDAAREALKIAAGAGYFRSILVPGCGYRTYYQPTPKAAEIRGNVIPKFLRAGLSPAAAVRGLLRHAASIARPELAPLTVVEQLKLSRDTGVQERGHARALLAREPGMLHIFVPVLPSESAAGVAVGAAARWLPLVELDPFRLHFVTPAGGQVAAKLRAVLAVTKPTNSRAELAELDARIAADHTGLLSLRLASERAKLAEAVEASSPPARLFAMLGEVIELKI